MIILPQLKQTVSKTFKSSARRLKSFVSSPKPHSLVRSPEQDLVLKQAPITNIFGINPKETIKNIINESTSATGKDAAVFNIPNHENIVLRVEKSALEKINNLSDDIKLLPIKHHKNIADKDNLGLPIYSVIDKTSPLYTREYLLPSEALAQKDNITVLKKVTGKHPARETYKAFIQLAGANKEKQNLEKFLDLKQLLFIRKNYGRNAAKECITNFAKNDNLIIPKGFFEETSPKFIFSNTKEFFQDYKKFVDLYKKELKEIAELPTESYQKAVDTILTDKNFLIDFQHTNNTFVDVKNKKFNFMDFEYDKSNAKYICENPIKEFRNVLLGKCFAKFEDRPLKSPATLLFNDADVEICKNLIEKISKKVNDATPEKFKFLKN